jgi:hypothetical protein
VLVCKLDASAGEASESQVLTLAGYVAFLPSWSEFEIAVKRVFDSYGVDVLHAKQFYDTKGAFTGWSLDKKKQFIRDIHEVSLGRLELGVCFSAQRSKFEAVKHAHRVGQSESLFGFSLRPVIHSLLTDNVLASLFARGESLTLILESGDTNAADAQRIFNWAKKRNALFDRILYSFGFADKKSSHGLQWADFLAVTMRRHIDDYVKTGTLPDDPPFIEILRNRFYLISQFATAFEPVRVKRGRSRLV